MGTKVVDASGGGIGKVQGFGSTPGKVLSGSFTFTDNYAAGGEACDVTEYFKELHGLIVESKGGYLFTYNPATKKIQAYNPLSAHKHDLDFVEEEVVEVADNVGALANNAALIQNVQVTAAAADKTGAYSILAAGVVPATKEVAVDMTPAAGKTSLTFLAADAVTEAKVTYLKAASSVKDNAVGAGSEVADGTNLSTLGALRWFAWGS